MRKMIAIAIIGAGMLVAAAPIWAHHVFAPHSTGRSRSN
jgi:hypothetical protein